MFIKYSTKEAKTKRAAYDEFIINTIRTVPNNAGISWFELSDKIREWNKEPTENCTTETLARSMMNFIIKEDHLSYLEKKRKIQEIRGDFFSNTHTKYIIPEKNMAYYLNRFVKFFSNAM